MNSRIHTSLLLAFTALMLLASCNSRGPQYRKWVKDKKSRGVDPGPPNMVFIPAGEYIAGENNEGTSAERYTVPHKVEVEQFYMDRTEVTNFSYLIYLKNLRALPDEVEYRLAIPDTLCWRDIMSYNEPMVNNYFRHPSYRYYPVVGVSWVQASRYCEWRSTKVNALDSNNPSNWVIRLPTEEEWEYAALASYSHDELALENERNFSIRQESGFGRGKFMHNFRRRGGDYEGLSHRPNDAALSPAPVYMYEANDYGLYNIFGNVAEWVSDEFSPYTIDLIIPEEDELAELKTDSTEAMENFVDPNATFNDILAEYGIEDLRDPGAERVSLGQVNRVYKGASWYDRAYYLYPGVRRYADERSATSYIGFRCATSEMEDVQAKQTKRAKARVNNSGVGGLGDGQYYEEPEEEEGENYEEVELEEAPEAEEPTETKEERKAREKAEKEAEKQRKAEEKAKKKKEKEEAEEEGGG